MAFLAAVIVLKARPDGETKELTGQAKPEADCMVDAPLELEALRVGEPGATPLPPRRDAKFNRLNCWSPPSGTPESLDAQEWEASCCALCAPSHSPRWSRHCFHRVRGVQRVPQWGSPIDLHAPGTLGRTVRE
ncbi:hypothetical protein PCASD_07778 [Puccinia coronata f. sp. avenae]|uniref:Uncharacterized protein n=1 Tax=Puccinia coronata f. sp. avenae TaxID=200324 RepID=A0A2N5US09_9BASI|nr:hypothetical protein PCASD_07778 [Puccinia coronata f. sp. avenae]